MFREGGLSGCSPGQHGSSEMVCAFRWHLDFMPPIACCFSLSSSGYPRAPGVWVGWVTWVCKGGQESKGGGAPSGWDCGTTPGGEFTPSAHVGHRAAGIIATFPGPGRVVEVEIRIAQPLCCSHQQNKCQDHPQMSWASWGRHGAPVMKPSTIKHSWQVGNVRM